MSWSAGVMKKIMQLTNDRNSGTKHIPPISNPRVPGTCGANTYPTILHTELGEKLSKA